jgi:hypothetical protein
MQYKDVTLVDSEQLRSLADKLQEYAHEIDQAILGRKGIDASVIYRFEGKREGFLDASKMILELIGEKK